jgi:hypothetical protein
VQHGTLYATILPVAKRGSSHIVLFLIIIFCKEIVRRRNTRLAWWNIVCRPKDQGGLGVHDLLVKTSALLGKWLFRFLTENEVWQDLLRRKYVASKALSQVYWKPVDSHFWAGLMVTKKDSFALDPSILRMALK